MTSCALGLQERGKGEVVAIIISHVQTWAGINVERQTRLVWKESFSCE